MTPHTRALLAPARVAELEGRDAGLAALIAAGREACRAVAAHSDNRWSAHRRVFAAAFGMWLEAIVEAAQTDGGGRGTTPHPDAVDLVDGFGFARVRVEVTPGGSVNLYAPPSLEWIGRVYRESTAGRGVQYLAGICDVDAALAVHDLRLDPPTRDLFRAVRSDLWPITEIVPRWERPAGATT